jgi:hypothetical protein
LSFGAVFSALAEPDAPIAAAPASVAPVRKLRRGIAGESSLRFESVRFMNSSVGGFDARARAAAISRMGCVLNLAPPPMAVKAA